MLTLLLHFNAPPYRKITIKRSYTSIIRAHQNQTFQRLHIKASHIIPREIANLQTKLAHFPNDFRPIAAAHKGQSHALLRAARGGRERPVERRRLIKFK